MHGQDTENFAPPFPDMCWFALSLVLITYTDFAEVAGRLPPSFSRDYVVAVNDTKRT